MFFYMILLHLQGDILLCALPIAFGLLFANGDFVKNIFCNVLNPKEFSVKFYIFLKKLLLKNETVACFLKNFGFKTKAFQL
jgi:hypothetical protein